MHPALKANMLIKEYDGRPSGAGWLYRSYLSGRLMMSEIMMLIYISPEAANTLCQMYRFHYSVLHGSESDRLLKSWKFRRLISNEDCLEYLKANMLTARMNRPSGFCRLHPGHIRWQDVSEIKSTWKSIDADLYG